MGEMLVMVGITWNLRLLVSVAFGVVTVTNPATAFAGTTADRYVWDEAVNVADAEPNFTLVAFFSPLPTI